MSYKQEEKMSLKLKVLFLEIFTFTLSFFFLSPKYLMPFTETNIEKLHSPEFP